MEGCGGVLKDAEGCGRMWEDVKGCGGMWKGVKGYGGMWILILNIERILKDVEGFLWLRVFYRNRSSDKSH